MKQSIGSTAASKGAIAARSLPLCVRALCLRRRDMYEARQGSPYLPLSLRPADRAECIGSLVDPSLSG